MEIRSQEKSQFWLAKSQEIKLQHYFIRRRYTKYNMSTMKFDDYGEPSEVTLPKLCTFFTHNNLI